MVHVTRLVHLPLIRARTEGPLLTHQDVKVVVRGVHARVPLRTERRTEDDEVLRDARVNKVHRAHGTARVVEHPLGGVGVQADLRGRVRRGEVRVDVVDDRGHVARVRGDGGLRDLVQALGVEDIPAVLFG